MRAYSYFLSFSSGVAFVILCIFACSQFAYAIEGYPSNYISKYVVYTKYESSANGYNGYTGCNGARYNGQPHSGKFNTLKQLEIGVSALPNAEWGSRQAKDCKTVRIFRGSTNSGFIRAGLYHRECL